MKNKENTKDDDKRERTERKYNLAWERRQEEEKWNDE